MSATDYLPARKTFGELKKAVQNCEGCDLYRAATQAVFGEGPLSASLILVGEQPGDEEDTTGKPFVGPAGKWLNRALEEAGISREDVYVTNIVKHFNYVERGARRLHKKPSARQIKACVPWLESEFDVVTANVVVCLGASASQGLLGNDFRITVSRGKPIDFENGRIAIATWHPSAVLRAPTPEQRETMHRELVNDLKLALTLCTQ